MDGLLKDRISSADYEKRFGKIGDQKEEDEPLSEESSVNSEDRRYLEDDGLEPDSRSQTRRSGRTAARGMPGGGADADKDSMAGGGFNLHQGRA